MIASKSSLTPLTILPKSDAGSIAEAYDVVAAPSWTSRMTMSAPCALSFVGLALAASTMSVTSMSAMPPGATSSGRCSVTAPTKPTWTSPKSLIQVAGSAGLPVALEPDVGTEVLPLRAAVRVVVDVVGSHHAVDQVVVPLVELVVAHRGHVETGLVERVDRRLVLLDEGLERRRTDEVTRCREDRVGVLGPAVA